MTEKMIEPVFGGSIDLAWDYYECVNITPLTDPLVHETLVTAIGGAGFTYVDSCLHSFGENHGYSFVSIIGESHVAIHTWPERGALELTIHYCNYTKNNDALALALLEHLKLLFAPQRIVVYEKRTRCIEV
jgi:S-adenosylmethionine/arginine decarboxylase-like enzyme